MRSIQTNINSQNRQSRLKGLDSTPMKGLDSTPMKGEFYTNVRFGCTLTEATSCRLL